MKWKYPIVLILILVTIVAGCAAPSSPSPGVERTMVSFTLEPTDAEDGLHVLHKTIDGVTDEGWRSGRRCLLLAGTGKPTSYMVFNIQNDFIYTKVTNVIVTVDYFDAGTGWLALEYDSSDFTLPQEGRFKTTPQIELQASDKWYTATFYLPDAYFADRQYDGFSDFRIASTSSYSLAIAQVTVSTTVSDLQQGLMPTATTQLTRFILQTDVSPPEGGTVSPDSGVYAPGTYLDMTATPASGYMFVSWSGDTQGTENPKRINMNHDRYYQANFELVPKNHFTLQLVSNPPGSCMFRPDSGAYPAGTTLEVMAIPSPGSRFLSWSGDVQSTSSHITITMDRNYTLQANFGAALMPTLGRLIISVSGTGSPYSIYINEGLHGKDSVSIMLTPESYHVTIYNSNGTLVKDEMVSVSANQDTVIKVEGAE